MYSIIVDKDLKSFIPRHLINEAREEIEYEFDFYVTIYLWVKVCL